MLLHGHQPGPHAQGTVMDCMDEREDDEDDCVDGWETASSDEAAGAGDDAAAATAQPGGASADMAGVHSITRGRGLEVSLVASLRKT